jgi:FAD/FMN-containing dehydrogenase
LVIDVGQINTVTVDGASQTVTVGAGARLIDIYATLAEHGLAIPAGTCGSVGIAGLTLGGGISALSRAFGLTCDNLQSVTLITAEGSVVDCHAKSNSELFWACQGGGGGNFGIATSFTFNARPVREVTRVVLEWHWSYAVRVMASWQEWAPQAQDEIGSSCQFRSHPGWAEPGVRVLIVFLGSPGELEPSLDNLIGPIGVEPLRTVESQSYLQAMLTNAGCRMMTLAECHLTPSGKLDRELYSAKSAFFEVPLPHDALERMISYVERTNQLNDFVEAAITFHAFGGAINRVHPNATAFIHRRALFNAQYYISWKENSLPAARFFNWLHDIHEALRRFSNGRAYINYADPDLPNWQTAYYGSNYERLVKVKAQVDSGCFFRLPQGIKPA